MSVKTCHTLLVIFVCAMCLGLARVGWHFVMMP